MRCTPLPREVPTWHGLQRLYGESDTSLRQSAGIVDQRDFAMIDLAYSCGLRRCELHNIDIADIDEEQGTLRVRGKGGRQRVVPIGPKTLADLLHYLYHVRPQLCKHGATRALFVSWNQGGKRMHLYSINAAFRRLRKRGVLEKGVTPHRLRHGFATDLIKNGAPVQDVSRMLGHVRLETTQVYTRLYPLDLKAHHTHHHPRG
jgi:site-specific recombinase XerD